MKTQLISSPPEQIEADALALILFEANDDGLPEPAAALDAATSGLISELYEKKEFSGKAFETAWIHRPAGYLARRMLLVGGGKSGEFSSTKLRQAAGTALLFAKKKGVRNLAIAPAGDLDPAERIQLVAEGAILADYETGVYKTTEDEAGSGMEQLSILGGLNHKSRLERGRVIAEAQNFARALVNEPGNLLTPAVLAERAIQLAYDTGLEVQVLRKPQMEEMKMGALLGVAQGSSQPPVMIVVRYQPKRRPRSGEHLGLVGKAVTFDTGGISIKPSEGMEKMKYDMAGGAAMLGAMKALSELKPAIPVTAVIPSVENMPGAESQRPGDVVTSMSGKTIEVLNTDAEGRLILADALTYARQQGCTHLVDAATLTGSIVVALGHERVGVFSNDESWQRRFLAASEAAGEKMWPMPLDEEYKDQLKSPIADLPNIGTRWGGAITAAMFLKQFADPAPWIHLDIAGTAWIEKEKPYLPEGPSGIPVRTLIQVAMDS